MAFKPSASQTVKFPDGVFKIFSLSRSINFDGHFFQSFPFVVGSINLKCAVVRLCKVPVCNNRKYKDPTHGPTT